MRISDGSSDVCSSDLVEPQRVGHVIADAEVETAGGADVGQEHREIGIIDRPAFVIGPYRDAAGIVAVDIFGAEGPDQAAAQALFVIEEAGGVIIFGHADQRLARERVVALDLRIRQRRSEEQTSELQSLMRISYAVFCLKK